MAYYEYNCKNCHVSVASIHKMSETFSDKCKFCGANDWMQVYFPPALKFTGTGFYETDYKNKGK